MDGNLLESVKKLVPMPEAAERYGYPPDRAGYIHCPFHSEKTASCKCYPEDGGFYCFGCGAGGSVIDFAARLFDVKPLEAVKRLNADFSLGLPLDRPMTAKEREEVQSKRAKAKVERALQKRKNQLLESLAACLRIADEALERGPAWTKKEETAIRAQGELDFLWNDLFERDTLGDFFITPYPIFGTSKGVEAERLCKEILGGASNGKNS